VGVLNRFESRLEQLVSGAFARAFRSAVHGFVLLEAAGGFGIPVDLDDSFDRLVATLAGGFATGQ